MESFVLFLIHAAVIDDNLGMKKHTRLFVLVLFFGLKGFLWAQNSDGQKIIYTEKQNAMRITAKDIRLIPEKDGEFSGAGYHLYVKKLPGVESILLTETTKDPLGKADSYAYRAEEYNPINGDEIRYLDGKPLVSNYAKYSLVDSTVEKTDFFGDAFHIYIPAELVYGYPWSRNGTVEIGKGTFINIRSFEKSYADYSGDYMDSPFMFNLETRRKPHPKPVKKDPPDPPVEEEPEPEPEPEPIVLTDDYNPIASETFKELSDEIIYSKGPETIVDDIKKILDSVKDKQKLDVVFAIDATGSMKNDLETLKKDLLPALLESFADCPETRFGLLFYRDYGDNFSYKGLPVRMFNFTTDLKSFSKNLGSIRIYGKEGGDIPEAVYEAMYASVEFYSWRADVQKLVILIGDAQPHPTPRGTKKYSKEFVTFLAKEKDVTVQSILLPND